MDAQQAATLREPFPDTKVGKLPRVTCPDCRKKRCQQHQRSKCAVCNNYITSAHMHIDYVGHAAVTDRLLTVDPGWTWEPLAFDERGLPAIGTVGDEVVLWAKLTVLGVSKIEVGSVAKNSFDLHKQLVSDFLSRGAMRFGVALDLWSKEDIAPEPDQEPEPQSESEVVVDQRRVEIGFILGSWAGDDPRRPRMRHAREDNGWPTSMSDYNDDQLDAALALARQLDAHPDGVSEPQPDVEDPASLVGKARAADEQGDGDATGLLVDCQSSPSPENEQELPL